MSALSTTLPKALSTVLLGALLLTGCTGGSDEAGTVSSEGTASSEAGGDSAGLAVPESVPAEPDSATRDGAPAAGDQTGGRTAGTTTLDASVLPGDAVIRTADLQVEVEDVRRSADQAGQIARDAGGRVASEQRSGTGEDGSATLQLRVPPAAFDDAVRDLAALGTEKNRQIGSEDVTDAVVDLEARLNSQRASVARVTALLAEATNLGEVVQIEGELTRRTADLEALEARLAALEAQIELSTITVSLFTAGDEPTEPGPLGFSDGLRNGWEAITAAARVVAVTAGAVLPFLPLVLLVGYVVVRARRSRPAA